MKGNFENTSHVESTEKEPHLILRIIRHGEKAGGNWNPDDEDYLIPLTEEGRENAHKRHIAGAPKQALAFGSGRVRANETAARALVGENPEIENTPEYTELEKEINKDVPLGSKIRNDERLDMAFVKQDEVHERLEERGNEVGYLKALDEDYVSAENSRETVYGKQVENLSDILLEHVQKATNWKRLVEKKPGEYENTLVRYLGTHGGVLDAFVAEVLASLHGKDARADFIERFPNCIPYAASCDIEIVPSDNDVAIRLIMRIEGEKESEDFELNEIVPLSLIQKMSSSKDDTQ
jgi:hypothetical protein